MIDPRDILALAKEIERNAKTEAELRNCIGRAYYAAFLVARTHRNAHGIPFATIRANGDPLGSHEQVIDSVQYFSPTMASFFQSQLDKLKYLRRRADYELGQTFRADAARNAVLDAESFIKWVDNLSQRSLPPP